MKHFKLVLSGLNVEPLLQHIIEHDTWDSQKSGRARDDGSRVYDADNLILYTRSNPPYQRSMPSSAILSSAHEILSGLLQVVPGVLGQVIITRLFPGDRIDWHIDPSLPNSQVYQRFQIPLQVAPGVRFCIEDEECYMTPGTVWSVDINRRHAVFNDSDQTRISMYTDIRTLTLGSS